MNNDDQKVETADTDGALVMPEDLVEAAKPAEAKTETGPKTEAEKHSATESNTDPLKDYFKQTESAESSHQSVQEATEVNQPSPTINQVNTNPVPGEPAPVTPPASPVTPPPTPITPPAPTPKDTIAQKMEQKAKLKSIAKWVIVVINFSLAGFLLYYYLTTNK